MFFTVYGETDGGANEEVLDQFYSRAKCSKVKLIFAIMYIIGHSIVGLQSVNLDLCVSLWLMSRKTRHGGSALHGVEIPTGRTEAAVAEERNKCINDFFIMVCKNSF